MNVTPDSLGNAISRESTAPAAPAVVADGTWHARWLVMLGILYALPVVGALRPVTDPDVWWHLRTGEWIVRHGAVPWTDPFSAYGAGQHWIAYNWLFNVAFHALYHAFGLFGPLIYSTSLALAATLLLHALVVRYEPRVTRSAALTAVGVATMGSAFGPRSYLVSVVLFLALMYVLLSARQSRRTRPLLIVPLLFVLWANVHIQYIYGFLALALCGVESLAARFVTSARIDTSRALPLSAVVGVGAASLLATLVNPYHVYLHWSVLEVILQTGVFNMIRELQAMDFRQPADWVVLGLALAAAFALGRQRRIEIFPTLLFIAAVFLAFRSARDVWMVAIISVLILAGASATGWRPATWLTWPRGVVVAGAVAVAVVVVGIVRGVSPSGLEATMSRTYPVEAARVVAARELKGPLYNPYDWGGFLIWRLPHLPVSMDNRANVHGDERIFQSLRSWLGHRTWASDPDIAAANLVIGPADIALTSILRLDPRFTLVHEDDVAVVFVRDTSPAPSREVRPR